MKKIFTICIAVFVLVSLSVTAFAVKWNWKDNQYTYAESTHEGFWEDKYYAEVSVRGLDSYFDFGTGYHYYPTFSRLTYNVQGEVTVVEVRSNGPDDSQRTDTDTIYDKWNEGPATTVNYRFGEARNIHINSILEPIF